MKRNSTEVGIVNQEHLSPVKTRKKIGSASTATSQCFFCDQEDGILHRSETMLLDRKVKAAVTLLQDRKLLAKLACGDMHANDAYYHLSCLSALYNRVRRHKQEQHKTANLQEQNQQYVEAVALAELVTFIEERASEGHIVFILSDLVKLYTSRLIQLEANVPQRINSTRLKERLLSQLPDLPAYNEGREVKLVFTRDVSRAVQYAEKKNFDEEIVHLAKAQGL